MMHPPESRYVSLTYLDDLSGSPRISVDIIKNKDGLTTSDMLYRQQKDFSSFGEKSLLLIKTTVAGREALLNECIDHTGTEFSRKMTVLSGDNIVTVKSSIPVVDRSLLSGKTRQVNGRIEKCREIAQRIESSLKF